MLSRELLEPDAVHAFAAFAEHLNFTAAAADLHLSQPSLHAKIRKLQSALGTGLYEREGRGLRLTAAGERLAVFARDAGRHADDLLADLHAQSAQVLLAAGRGAFRWVIADGIRRLAGSEHPLRVLTADREGALRAVQSGHVDVAVVAHEPPPPSMRCEQIASYSQILVMPAGHELASRTALSVRDLHNLALVVPPPDRPHRRNLEKALLESGVNWSVAAEVDGWDLLVHFTSLGLGLAVVNGCVTPPAGLSAVAIVDLPVIRYWAVWRAERDHLAQDVLTHLRPGLPASRAQ